MDEVIQQIVSIWKTKLLCELNEGCSEEQLVNWEQHHGCILPQSFKALYKAFNGLKDSSSNGHPNQGIWGDGMSFISLENLNASSELLEDFSQELIAEIVSGALQVAEEFSQEQNEQSTNETKEEKESLTLGKREQRTDEENPPRKRILKGKYLLTAEQREHTLENNLENFELKGTIVFAVNYAEEHSTLLILLCYTDSSDEYKYDIGYVYMQNEDYFPFEVSLEKFKSLVRGEKEFPFNGPDRYLETAWMRFGKPSSSRFDDFLEKYLSIAYHLKELGMPQKIPDVEALDFLETFTGKLMISEESSRQKSANKVVLPSNSPVAE